MEQKNVKQLFKTIMGGLIIAFVLLLTIKFIKVLPIIMKLMALAANILTIYLAYNYFINNKNKN